MRPTHQIIGDMRILLRRFNVLAASESRWDDGTDAKRAFLDDFAALVNELSRNEKELRQRLRSRQVANGN
jgi:hypothetical protein